MTVYFPDRYSHLQQVFDSTMCRLRKAAIAAVAGETEAAMEAAYVAAFGALKDSSFGTVGRDERRFRQFLSEQLEDVRFHWEKAGAKIYDLEDDRAELQPHVADPFDALLTSDAFLEVSYVHLGEVRLTGAELCREAHLDGFFIQPATIGDDRGTMLTFTCSPNEEPGDINDLGSLLRSRSRMAQAWISNTDVVRQTVRPVVSGDPDVLRDRSLSTALGFASSAISLIIERLHVGRCAFAGR